MRIRSERFCVDVADEHHAGECLGLMEDNSIIRMRLLDPAALDNTRLSDAMLHLAGHGKKVALSATVQLHCLGAIRGPELLDFLEASQQPIPAGGGSRTLKLYDLDQAIERDRIPNGVELIVGEGVSMLTVGSHCFGFAYGHILAKFFRRAWLRATTEKRTKVAA